MFSSNLSAIPATYAAQGQQCAGFVRFKGEITDVYDEKPETLCIKVVFKFHMYHLK